MFSQSASSRFLTALLAQCRQDLYTFLIVTKQWKSKASLSCFLSLQARSLCTLYFYILASITSYCQPLNTRCIFHWLICCQYFQEDVFEQLIILLKASLSKIWYLAATNLAIFLVPVCIRCLSAGPNPSNFSLITGFMTYLEAYIAFLRLAFSYFRVYLTLLAYQNSGFLGPVFDCSCFLLPGPALGTTMFSTLRQAFIICSASTLACCSSSIWEAMSQTDNLVGSWPVRLLRLYIQQFLYANHLANCQYRRPAPTYHTSILTSMPRGGLSTFSSSILTYTQRSLLSTCCFRSSCSLSCRAEGSSGLAYLISPSGRRFLRLGFPQNSMQLDILSIFQFIMIPQLNSNKQSLKYLRHCLRSFSIIFFDSDSLMPLAIGLGRQPTINEVSLCTQYPLVSQSSPSTLRVDLAHWLLVATENEAVCLDMLLSTNMGFRLRMSMELLYSRETAWENPSTKHLVAVQLETQGAHISAEKEETLMMADLLSLLSMQGMVQLDIITQGTQFTTISSSSLWSEISCRYPMLEMPTLLTRIDVFSRMPLFSSVSNILPKKRSFVLLVKSATTQSVLILFSQFALILFRASTIFYSFLASMQMLKPRAASSQQKPRPIPSLAPVTTAQVFSPQRSWQFFSGRIIFTRLHSSLARKTARQRAPTTARKQTKLRVDCSMFEWVLKQNYKLHQKWLRALILLLIRSSILFSSWSQMVTCFSRAIIRPSLWMQHRSTCLLTSSGFLLEAICTSDRVNSQLPTSLQQACSWSMPFSARKSCSFLLWLKIVLIIYLTSYSLLALEVVATEFSVSECFCDERGRRPMEDLGLTGIWEVVLSSSCYPSWLDLSRFTVLGWSFSCPMLFLLRFSFRFRMASSLTLETEDTCFMLVSWLILLQTALP